MSFTFGGIDFDETFAGSCFIQRKYPNVSGLAIESLEIPGMERRRFLRTDRPRTQVTFDVLLYSDTEAGVEDVRQQFMIYVDPARGPQPLIVDQRPDWQWQATVAEEIIWERVTWNCTAGFRLRADVTFESFDDAAQRRVDAETDYLEFTDNTTFQLWGDTRAWPRIEITGTLAADASVRVAVLGGRPSPFTVDVQGPLAAGQTMVLDYDLMRFDVRDGTGLKVASLVNRMSTLDRVELDPLYETSIGLTSTSGTWAEVARNLAFNPSFVNLGVERGDSLPDTIGMGGSASGTIETSGTGILYGSTALKITPNPGGSSASAAYPVLNSATRGDSSLLGKTITSSVYVTITHPFEGYSDQYSLTCPIGLRPAGGSTDLYFARSDQAPNEAGTHRLSVTAELPADAAFWCQRLLNSTNLAENFSVWDGYMITEGTEVLDYFDGDTPATSTDRYSWTGTAHASESIHEQFQPDPVTLTARIYPNSRYQ